MTLCEKCLHAEVCAIRDGQDEGDEIAMTYCSDFQGWISVEDRLPEPNAHVLLYAFFHNQWQIVKGWHSYCDKKFHISNSDYPSLTDVPVAHWMPLPEAPKMTRKEDERK